MIFLTSVCSVLLISYVFPGEAEAAIHALAVGIVNYTTV